jgi:hypothetical protein
MNDKIIRLIENDMQDVKKNGICGPVTLQRVDIILSCGVRCERIFRQRPKQQEQQ